MVADLVAHRGFTNETAREHVETTQLLVQAAMARAQSQPQPAPERPEDLLPPKRAEHLRRTGLARLWLRAVFEPSVGPNEIPQAMRDVATQRVQYVRPEVLHHVCMVSVLHPNNDPDQRAFDAAGRHTLEPLLAWWRGNIEPSHEKACKWMETFTSIYGYEQSTFKLSWLERALDLNAAEVDPRFSAPILAAQAPAFVGPIVANDGVHVGLLVTVLPALPADAPHTQARIEQDLLPAARAEVFAARLHNLAEQHGVRTALAQPE